MSGDHETPSENSEDEGSNDSVEEEDTLQSQAVFKGPRFLRRMLGASEDDEET